MWATRYSLKLSSFSLRYNGPQVFRLQTSEPASERARLARRRWSPPKLGSKGHFGRSCSEVARASDCHVSIRSYLGTFDKHSSPRVFPTLKDGHLEQYAAEKRDSCLRFLSASNTLTWSASWILWSDDAGGHSAPNDLKTVHNLRSKYPEMLTIPLTPFNNRRH